MDDYTDLKRWCALNRFYMRKETLREGESFSHFFMDGGSLVIPSKCQNEFMKKYVNGLIHGHKYYLSECRTELFKFFIDMDIFELLESGMDTDIVVEIVKEVQNVMNNYYPIEEPTVSLLDDGGVSTTQPRSSKDLHCYICLYATGKPKETTHRKEKAYKTGVHCVWPNIVVDIHQALQLRDSILHALILKFGERPEYNLWKEVIDHRVYTQTGLRLCGSGKSELCKKCKKRKDQNCIDCLGTGYIKNDVHIYLPKFIMNNLGQIKKLTDKDTQLKTILKLSIRQTDHTIKTPVNPKISAFYEQKSLEELTKKPPRKFKNKDGETIVSSKVFIAPYDDRYQAIKTLINDCNINELQFYKNVEITDIFYHDSNYYLVRTNSSYCNNLQREHSSVTIYFYINKYKIFQKCFCRCDTTADRIKGLCEDYRSDGVFLTDAMRSALFTDLEQEMFLIDKSLAQNTLDDNQKEMTTIRKKQSECETLMAKLQAHISQNP